MKVATINIYCIELNDALDCNVSALTDAVLMYGRSLDTGAWGILRLRLTRGRRMSGVSASMQNNYSRASESGRGWGYSGLGACQHRKNKKLRNIRSSNFVKIIRYNIETSNCRCLWNC